MRILKIKKDFVNLGNRISPFLTRMIIFVGGSYILATFIVSLLFTIYIFGNGSDIYGKNSPGIIITGWINLNFNYPYVPVIGVICSLYWFKYSKKN